jgi:hypothetical protein
MTIAQERVDLRPNHGAIIGTRSSAHGRSDERGSVTEVLEVQSKNVASARKEAQLILGRLPAEPGGFSTMQPPARRSGR